MLKTPVPATKHTETDTDKYFSYLVNHVTRSTDDQPIATISPDQSAQRTWTTPQVTVLAMLATLTLIALWCFGIAVLTGIFAVVTALYVALLAMSTSWMIAVSRTQPETPFDEQVIHDLAKAPWPAYTVLCPLYHEKNIVPQFVKAMQALDYPQDCLQVLFLTEQDDRETRAAIRAMNLPANFEVLIVPQGTPKTKPRACNYGLTKVSGEYCVIYDAEDIPDPLQLKKAVLTFASNDVNVACVQARLNFYNSGQNLLTRWFTAEYSLWFDLILPGLQRLGFSLPLGGTSNHFRISALKALGGWDSYNVTEDADLGLKLVKYGFKTIMLDSTTYEEANSQILSWIRQRSRWIKGYMQTYLVHTRHPLKTLRQGKVKDLLSLHLFIGAGSVVLLINPVMWCMFAAYLIWRPVDLYHQLFPWPILYAGMLCFLVGNFLPVYVSMIACVKREQYSLVKWCLLLPLYWILASVAAFMAGYELIKSPHKWHKTQHGLHLKDKRSTEKIVAISMKTESVSSVAKVGTVTQSVKAMSTVLVPAVGKMRGKRTVKARDPWLVATIVLACVCSVAACSYYFLHHDILLYNDAFSHIKASRRLIDNATPGIGQLGTVWLPIPHLLMLPFIWNDYLWRTGLAGSIPSMAAYVVASVYLYLTAWKLTGNKVASCIGVLVFALNPNVLYLQSTPLTEIICTAALVITSFYFFCWIQEDRPIWLVLTALFSFLATLARYDAWPLFLVIFVLVGVIGILRKQTWRKTESNFAIFGFLGCAGIVLWLIWNQVIFGSALYFQRGPYSAQHEQLQLLNSNSLFTYHSIYQSIRYYILDAGVSLGWGLSVILFIGIATFVLLHKRRLEAIGILICLIPIVFYIYSLYSGQAVIYLPGAVPANYLYQFFNVRYGVQVVAPAALFVAYLLSRLLFFKTGAGRYILSIVFISIIVTQAIFTTKTGIVSLQDGLYGASCASYHPINTYLVQHYDNGMILEQSSTASTNESEIGLDFHHIIYEGSNGLWNRALVHPEEYVHWVVMAVGSGDDQVYQHVRLSKTFFTNFKLILKEQSGLQLYEKVGLPPLPNNPLPSGLKMAHQQCGIGGH